MNKLAKPNQDNSAIDDSKLDDIDLSGLEPIAKGTKRKVFHLPGDDTVIVKVYRSTTTPSHQRKQRNFRKISWLRNPIVFDQNRYDLRELKRIYDKLGDIAWHYFPKTRLSLVNTSLGEGLVQRKILDADGNSSKNLKEFLRTFGQTEALDHALSQLKNFLSMHHIVIRDLSVHNLAVRTDKEQNLHIMMIDGFGNSDIVKFADYFSYFNDKKLDRKFDRLARNMVRVLQNS